jgi:hypothetical protein
MDNFDKGGEAKEMPWKYKVEMICDYLGAARAYMGKDFSYKAELDWWMKKLDLPRAQHTRDKTFVSWVLQTLAREERERGHKEATKQIKHTLLVVKEIVEKYGPKEVKEAK